MNPTPNAAGLVTAGLSACEAPDRSRFLRELMAHTAAGLVIVDGGREAAEAVYRLADAVVARAEESGPAFCPEPPRDPMALRVMGGLRRALRGILGGPALR